MSKKEEEKQPENITPADQSKNEINLNMINQMKTKAHVFSNNPSLIINNVTNRGFKKMKLKIEADKENKEVVSLPGSMYNSPFGKKSKRL